MAYISFKLPNMTSFLPLLEVSWRLSHLGITAKFFISTCEHERPWPWSAFLHSLLQVFQPQWHSSQSLKSATPFSISSIPVIPRSHSIHQTTDEVSLISHRENICVTTESNCIGKKRSSEQNLIRFHSIWIQLCPNLVIICNLNG